MSSDGVTASNEEKGLIDGADRIAKQLLGNSKFKQSMLILLSSVDPQSARGLVRTLFWEDPEMLLSVMGAAPDLVNALIVAMAEVAEQLKSMPAPLLQQLIGLVVQKIDGVTLGEAAGNLASIEIGPPGEEDGGVGDNLDRLRRDFREGYEHSRGGESMLSRLDGWMEKTASEAKDEGSPTHSLVEGIGTALERNPDFVEHVLKPILSRALEPGMTTGEGRGDGDG